MTKVRAGKRSGKRSEKRNARRTQRRPLNRTAALPEAGVLEPAAAEKAAQRAGEKTLAKSIEAPAVIPSAAAGHSASATAAQPRLESASSETAGAAKETNGSAHSAKTAESQPKAPAPREATAATMPMAEAEAASSSATQRVDECALVHSSENRAESAPESTDRSTPDSDSEAAAPASIDSGAPAFERDALPAAPCSSPLNSKTEPASEGAHAACHTGEAETSDLSGDCAKARLGHERLTFKSNASDDHAGDAAAEEMPPRADACALLPTSAATASAPLSCGSSAASAPSIAPAAALPAPDAAPGPEVPQAKAVPAQHENAEPSANAAAPEQQAGDARQSALPCTEKEALTNFKSTDNKSACAPIEETAERLASEPHPREAAAPFADNSTEDAGAASRRRFLGRIALFGGAAFAAAALLFAAANWAGWAPALRIGFFSLFALAPGLALLLPARMRTPLREDAAGTAFGLMLCLLLAVIGQTYQSGAGAASLLGIWSLLLTPWLFFVRRPMSFTLWFAAALLALLFMGDEILAGEARLARLAPGMLFACAAAVALSLAARACGGACRAAAVLPACAATLLSAGAATFMLLASAGNTPALSLVPAYMIAFGIAAAGFALSKRPELLSLIVFGAAALLEGVWFHTAGRMTSNPLAYVPGILIAFAALIALWRIGRSADFSHRKNQSAAAAELPESKGGDPACPMPAVRLRLDFVPRAASALLAALAVLLLLLLAQSIFELQTFETGLVLAVAALSAAAFFSRSRQTERWTPAILAAALLAAAGIAMVFIEATGGSSWSATVLSSILPLAASLVFRSSLALWAAMALPAAASAAYSPWLTGAAAAVAGLLVVLLRTPFADRKPRLANAAAKCLPAFIWMSWFGSGVLPWIEGQMLPDWASVEGLLLCAGALLAALGGFAALLRAGFGQLFSFGFLALGAAVMARFGPDAAPLLLALAGMTPIRGNEVGRRSLSPWLFLILFWSSAHAAYWLLPAEDGANLLLSAALDQFFFAALFGALFLLSGLEAKRQAASSAHALHVGCCEQSLLAKPQGLRRFDRPARSALLLLTAAFVALGILRDERILQTGEAFTAALAPVDPRDLLMGDFMALGYDALREAPSAAALRKAREAEGASPEDRHIRYKACFGVEETASGELLRLLAVKPEGDAPPEGTRLELAYDPTTRLAKLPSRWFFSSGEAPLWDKARFAALRCAEGRCLLAGLLDAAGRPIQSAEKPFFERLINARY